MRSFLTLTAKACASVDTTWPQERGSKRHANAGGAQTPPDVTAASFGVGCCTQSYPSTLALLSAIGKSCDSAGLNTGPADLPGLEPTKFDLVIATRTAKALGLTIPQSLRVQAELIE